MADNRSLQDTINLAREETREKVSASGNGKHSGKKRSINIPLLIFAILVLGLFKFFVIDEEARWVKEDLALSALDLFKEADASVILFHQEYGRLPETLPAAALAPFVIYRHIGETHYSLAVNLPYHDAVIERDIGNISPRANPLKSLSI